jgi:hypothetical protein
MRCNKFFISVFVIFILLLFSVSAVTDPFDLEKVDGEEDDPFGLEKVDGERDDPFGLEKNEDGDDTPTYDDSVSVAASDDGITYEEEVLDISQDQSVYNQVESIPSSDSVQTSQGLMDSLSMTNALFNFGNLVQGAFSSDEDNNNLFFGSLFDSSQFVATLDEGGEVEVAQKNSFGELGKVHVTLDGGNLTQDEVITFIPDGETPTYIYYNSTEIEFEDGTIEFLGESVTNLDNTTQSTKVEFDENGFTKIELHSQNTYVNFDYSIKNEGAESLIICKGDPLCDINIVGEVFDLSGEVSFSFEDDVVYTSFDNNNEVSLDVSSGVMSLSNIKSREEVLAYVYSSHHIVTVSSSDLYDLPVSYMYPSLVREFNGVYIGDVLEFEEFVSLVPRTSQYEMCLEELFCSELQ